MIAVRVIVGVLAVVGVAAVLTSMLRTVVLPRAVPARLARAAFLAVHWLLRLRLRLTGRSDYATRDRIFAVQAPLGVFAQLTTWGVMIWLLFAALFWSVVASAVNGPSISRALELSGSSMLTLGFDSPRGLPRQLLAFAAAGVGLTLLALVIAYLPTLYGAFSRREEVITKLSVRTGVPQSGLALLAGSWELGRFDQLEEVWDGWEDWFIDIGEAQTTFPQLSFFRSPHPSNHWVLASEAVLDGAALLIDGLRRAATIAQRAVPARRDPRPDLDRRLPRHSPPPARTRRGDPPLRGKVQHGVQPSSRHRRPDA